MKKHIYLKSQADKLTAGQIDRRQFIMSALAAGVVLPTAMSMAGDAIAATPNKGGPSAPCNRIRKHHGFDRSGNFQ